MGLKEALQGWMASYPTSSKVLTIIGGLIVLKKLLQLLGGIYRTIFRRPHKLIKRYGEKSWVFITGSSQGTHMIDLGIGRAFAQAFAKQGFNIILSARTQSKLQKVKAQILQKYPTVSIEYLAIDFKKSSPQYLTDKLQPLSEFDISILVNNVGVDVLDYYHKLGLDQINDLITINCNCLALLNRIFIPKFTDRLQKKKVRSAIINVASLAGEIPMPLHNVYSASKAFVDFLSRSLSYEYPKIDIISLRPSQVSTPMTYNKQTDILTIRPQDCVKGLLNDLGHDRTSNGYITHALQGRLFNVLPEWLFNTVFLKHIGPDFIKQREKAQGMKRD